MWKQTALGCWQTTLQRGHSTVVWNGISELKEQEKGELHQKIAGNNDESVIVKASFRWQRFFWQITNLIAGEIECTLFL